MERKTELIKIHEELMQEESIDLIQLPKELQSRIKGFNLLYDRFKNQGSNVDLKIFETLQIQTITIADRIQDFMELELESKDNVIPIKILDVDNTYVHMENGTVIVEKNDKNLITYSEKEVFEITIKLFYTLKNADSKAINTFDGFVEWFEENKKK